MKVAGLFKQVRPFSGHHGLTIKFNSKDNQGKDSYEHLLVQNQQQQQKTLEKGVKYVQS